LQGIERIALAPLVGNPFADATAEFFAQFERIMSLALSGPLRIERPFGKLTKRQVLAFGRDLPLELTFSCIAPRDGKHCGECNKCFERQQAFQSAEIVDPTKYHALGME
jgi:7-cyano-7-deazaguanine synthase